VRVEEGFALALGEQLKGMYEHVKKTLPPGAHFGIIIDIPASTPEGEGRIAALATNRNIVAPLAAQWAESVLSGELER
jgi:hypothetical protein